MFQMKDLVGDLILGPNCRISATDGGPGGKPGCKQQSAHPPGGGGGGVKPDPPGGGPDPGPDCPRASVDPSLGCDRDKGPRRAAGRDLGLLRQALRRELADRPHPQH